MAFEAHKTCACGLQTERQGGLVGAWICPECSQTKFPIVFYIPNEGAPDGRRYATNQNAPGQSIPLSDFATHPSVIVANDSAEKKVLLEGWSGLNQFLVMSREDATPVILIDLPDDKVRAYIESEYWEIPHELVAKEDMVKFIDLQQRVSK